MTYFLREAPPVDEAESATDDTPALDDDSGTDGPATDDDSEDDESEAEEEPKARIHLLGADGDTIRTLEGPAERGLHRVGWDLRYGADESDDDDEDQDGFQFSVTQPRVLPGVYAVHLDVDGVTSPPPRRLEVVLLYHYLNAHPDIFMSRMKELDFFVLEKNFSRGLMWYESNFSGEAKKHNRHLR